MQHRHTCWVIWLSLERLLLSSSVMSNSLWPNGLQHAGLPCPSVSPGFCSCSLSRWYHLTISSSVTRFSSCLQSFSASGSIPVSQLFVSGDQGIGVSASGSILLMNIPGWFPKRLTGLNSLLSKGLSRVFTTEDQKHQFFCTHPSLWSNAHIHTWLLEKLCLCLCISRSVVSACLWPHGL